MIRHYCDRCKSEIDTEIIRPFNHIVTGGGTLKYDLCDMCSNELRLFLRGKRLVQEARKPEIYEGLAVLCTECGSKIGEREACEKDEDNRVWFCPKCGTEVDWSEWEE